MDLTNQYSSFCSEPGLAVVAGIADFADGIAVFAADSEVGSVDRTVGQSAAVPAGYPFRSKAAYP